MVGVVFLTLCCSQWQSPSHLNDIFTFSMLRFVTISWTGLGIVLECLQGYPSRLGNTQNGYVGLKKAISKKEHRSVLFSRPPQVHLGLHRQIDYPNCARFRRRATWLSQRQPLGAQAKFKNETQSQTRSSSGKRQ